MKQTFLITGGAGFIGSHLIDCLMNRDIRIVCVDNFDDFYSKETKLNNIQQHRQNPDFKLYKADIIDKTALERIFAENKIDRVIHIAAKAGVRPSLENPQKYFETNINGTVNLLELTEKYGIKKFIFASSSSVYGARKDGPFNEEMKIDRPISPYAATKAAGEQICYTYSHLYGINIVCLRFFTVYGPRQRPDLAIHKFAKLITEGKPIPVFGDGTTKRDYTYIDDIIQGVTAAIDYEQTPFEVINLGESNTVELNYLIQLIEENLGKKAIIDKKPDQPGDVPMTYADVTRAKKLLNYNPKTNIEEGIREFTRWFLRGLNNG